MNVYKHTAASLVLSSLLMLAFRNIQISLSCLLAGIFIDLDHIFDYVMNRSMMDMLDYLIHPKKLARFLSSEYSKYKPLCKVYKPLHSIELLLPLLLLYIFGIRSDIVTGALLGFILHLSMDAMSLGHLGCISLIYKIRYKFPMGSDILRKRLSRIGRDANRCQICGTCNDVKPRIYSGKYFIITKKNLKEIMILCTECHEMMADDTQKNIRQN